MRKMLLLLAGAVVIHTNASAQTKTDAKQKAVDKVCGCMSKIKLDTVDQKKNQAAFMSCFTTDAMEEVLAFAMDRNVEFSDQKGMRNLGLELSKELLKQQCAGYMELIKLEAQNQVKESTDGPESSATRGQVARIDNKEFVYIILKDNTGREQSFIWLEYFEGSDQYIGAKVSTLVGKKIAIKWIEKEIYLPKAGGYFKLKQITGIAE